MFDGYPLYVAFRERKATPDGSPLAQEIREVLQESQRPQQET
jgi:hypothetical protein